MQMPPTITDPFTSEVTIDYRDAIEKLLNQPWPWSWPWAWRGRPDGAVCDAKFSPPDSKQAEDRMHRVGCPVRDTIVEVKSANAHQALDYHKAAADRLFGRLTVKHIRDGKVVGTHRCCNAINTEGENRLVDVTFGPPTLNETVRRQLRDN